LLDLVGNSVNCQPDLFFGWPEVVRVSRVGRVVVEEVAKWGLVLDGSVVARLQRYCRMVSEAREALGLTAPVPEEEFARYHVADALSCLLVMPDHLGGPLVDIGSGAGLPGVVLKVARPRWEVLLVEGARRKAAFLEWVVRELDLRGVTVVWGRAEELGRHSEYAGRCAWAVARAVGPLEVVIGYGWPLLRAGGRLVAQKGPRVTVELKSAEKALTVQGGRVLEVREVRVGERRRVLVVLEKGKEFAVARGID